MKRFHRKYCQIPILGDGYNQINSIISTLISIVGDEISSDRNSLMVLHRDQIRGKYYNDSIVLNRPQQQFLSDFIDYMIENIDTQQHDFDYETLAKTKARLNSETNIFNFINSDASKTLQYQKDKQ